MKNNIILPIIIKQTNNSEMRYLISIPDLDGMTEANSIPEAMLMAQDYIGTYSLDDELPDSNLVIPETKKDEIGTLVTVDIEAYKRKYDNKVVKKTITIPNYLNELGKENNINFSEVMTEALKEKLNA